MRIGYKPSKNAYAMNATLLKMAAILSGSIVFMQNVARTRSDAR
ncbi:hypothetical protein AB7M47_003649 [Bradyrhizobium elkanii]